MVVSMEKDSTFIIRLMAIIRYFTMTVWLSTYSTLLIRNQNNLNLEDQPSKASEKPVSLFLPS